jgi:hypothetical protein
VKKASICYRYEVITELAVKLTVMPLFTHWVEIEEKL